MNKCILIISAAMLTLGIVSKSRAEPAGDCGSSCQWSLTDEGVLIIKGSGEGATANPPHPYVSPWENYGHMITAIVVDNIYVPNHSGIGYSFRYAQPGAKVIYVNGGTAGNNVFTSIPNTNGSHSGGADERVCESDINTCMLSYLGSCPTGYKKSGDECVCKPGLAEYNNKCWEELPFAKKHWTPSEASQWLKDTDNEIIMTFKVNR